MIKIPFACPVRTEDDILAAARMVHNKKILTDGGFNEIFAGEFGKFLKGEYQGELPIYCLPTSSCMSALYLAYLTLGLKPGDEVICPAMSHVATAHAIELTGARPVFIDCDRFGNIHAPRIENAITHRTKAISVVHYNGFPCAIGEIVRIADDYGLAVVEDCALALGSRFDYKHKHVGLHGTFGAFSFYPSKHITTGEGGMLVCRDEMLYQKARSIASFGKMGGRYDYDVKHLGGNFRMSEFQAALGVLQMRRLEGFIEKRRDNYRVYHSKFCGGPYRFFSGPNLLSDESPYAYVIGGVDGRDKVMQDLERHGIGASVYYPHPIPKLTYYREKYGYQKVRFRGAEHIAYKSISLPVGPHLEKGDVEMIAGIVREVTG